MRFQRYSRSQIGWRCCKMARLQRWHRRKSFNKLPIRRSESSFRSEGLSRCRPHRVGRRNKGAFVMEKAKLELVVGIFVLIGIACLAYLSIKLGRLELIGGDVYEVEAQFDTATGLKAGASIEIAGVEVGRVKDITLKDDRAAVLLAVNKSVKLYSDTIASIKTRGIIGEKFMALSPGGGGDPLKPGDTIRDTESGLDLEELVSQYVHGKVN